MASPATKKRMRKPAASRRRLAVRDEHLKELMKEAVREVLREELAAPMSNTSPVTGAVDWLEEARELRSRMPLTANSTPLLRSMREERALR